MMGLFPKEPILRDVFAQRAFSGARGTQKQYSVNRKRIGCLYGWEEKQEHSFC
jgi:hypothetical protein